jgi:predicted RNA-binding Zn-ribbon protein involved in translation (DUF1610 family)
MPGHDRALHAEGCSDTDPWWFDCGRCLGLYPGCRWLYQDTQTGDNLCDTCGLDTAVERLAARHACPACADLLGERHYCRACWQAFSRKIPPLVRDRRGGGA